MTPYDAYFSLLKRIRPSPSTTHSVCVQPNPNLKVIVFDIYGTLLLHRRVHADAIPLTSYHQERLNAFVTALEFCGLRMHTTPANVFRRVFDIHKRILESYRHSKKNAHFLEVNIVAVWKQVLQRLLQDHKASKTNMSCEDSLRILSVAFECLTNPTYPMPYFKEALLRIRACKLRLGILSNAQFYTPYLMEFFCGKLRLPVNFRDLFDQRLCVYSYQLLFAKPNSKMFLSLKSALRQQHIRPNEVLYVGNDMLCDVVPAAEVGFYTALIAADKKTLRLYTDHPSCRRCEPTYMLKSLRDLYAIIDQKP